MPSLVLFGAQPVFSERRLAQQCGLEPWRGLAFQEPRHGNQPVEAILGQLFGFAEEALELLQTDADFDLVIATIREGDSDPGAFGAVLHEAGHDVPVLALAYTGRELFKFLRSSNTQHIERTFLYQGDVRLLLAMILYREDRLNVAHDIEDRGMSALI